MISTAIFKADVASVRGMAAKLSALAAQGKVPTCAAYIPKGDVILVILADTGLLAPAEEAAPVVAPSNGNGHDLGDPEIVPHTVVPTQPDDGE